tara:strand:- start:199 stop:354 length:156 start_codon:yes stop_codon:yes gene_type:complete
VDLAANGALFLQFTMALENRKVLTDFVESAKIAAGESGIFPSVTYLHDNAK